MLIRRQRCPHRLGLARANVILDTYRIKTWTELLRVGFHGALGALGIVVDGQARGWLE